MKDLFLSFDDRQELNEAIDVLSEIGHYAFVYDENYDVLKLYIKPEQEIEILERLDWFAIYVDSYDYFEDYLENS